MYVLILVSNLAKKIGKNEHTAEIEDNFFYFILAIQQTSHWSNVSGSQWTTNIYWSEE